MNWLLAVIFTIFFINMYQGYKKGLLTTALSLIWWVLIIVISNILAPQVAQMLISETSIDEKIIEFMIQKLMETADVMSLEEQIPLALRELLLGDFNSFEEILTADIFKIKEVFSPYVFQILRMLCTIILIILLRLAVITVNKFLTFITNFELIAKVDKTLGLFFGIVKGLVLVWILMSIITIGFMLNINSFDIAIINESQILRWLYENNPFLNVIINL